MNLDLIILFSAFLGLVCFFLGLMLIKKSGGRLKLSLIFLTLTSLTFAAGEIITFLNSRNITSLPIRDIINLIVVFFLLLSLLSIMLMFRKVKYK